MSRSLMSLLPSTMMNGMELSAQEFRHALLLRHARGPPDLPPFCDGCKQKFSMRHALECKKGGLAVISRHHSEIRDELSDLAAKALSLSAACDEPKIHLSQPGREFGQRKQGKLSKTPLSQQSQ
jgi:hypothetical protein